VSFTFVVVLSSLWYSSLFALWNFWLHVFFLPYNCFATSLQIPRCVSSTSIVVLLNVFGLSSFLIDKNYYTFSIFHMQQFFLKKDGKHANSDRHDGICLEYVGGWGVFFVHFRCIATQGYYKGS